MFQPLTGSPTALAQQAPRHQHITTVLIIPSTFPFSKTSQLQDAPERLSTPLPDPTQSLPGGHNLGAFAQGHAWNSRSQESSITFPV